MAAHYNAVRILTARIMTQQAPGMAQTRAVIARTIALIRQYWDQVEHHTRGFVDAIEDDVLTEVMHYKNMAGTALAFPRWETMVHQVNHATQHRSEVALLLTQANHSPGDLDLLDYMTSIH